jgi:hypothetical protein
MQARFIRNLLVLCMSMAIAHTANAQHAARIYIEPDGWSIGMNCGMSDLWGDIGTKSPMEHYTNSKYFDKVAVMGGMLGRYSVHPCFALRFGFNLGALYATDQWNYDLASVAVTQGSDPYQRYARGQNARSYIFEGSLLMELTPFRFNPESKGAHRRGQVYLAAGLGYFRYVPYSTIAASPTYVKTYELHLEGQGFGEGYPDKYNPYGFCIPMGLGYRWDLGQHLNLGIEYMWRMTFTDYIDGVSGEYVSNSAFNRVLGEKEATMAMQVADKGYWFGLAQPNVPGNMRGNPADNDSYSTISITFYYKLLTKTHEWWRN